MASFQDQHVVCLGGGHGLFQTLRAVRTLNPASVNAIVTVADDGGSSGRIRRELDQVPPGDLRMALSALAPFTPEGKVWEDVLQHRFGGHGALAGHAVGNLLIAGLVDVLGSQIQALDALGQMIGAQGRVLPVCEQPLDIAAEVSGLDTDPRIMREVRGQVAVASTPGSVRRVRLIPNNPQAADDAIAALAQADVITLGPGSWFSSVIPHLLVRGIPDALSNANAQRIVVLNLSPEPGETAGFSAERHLHILAQHSHSLSVDAVLVDAATIPNQADRAHLERAARAFGARIAYHDLREEDEAGRLLERHDPHKLAVAIAAESP